MSKKNKSSSISFNETSYYSDLYKDDMLFVGLIRSPVPSGIIENINVPDLPEGYFLFTANDIPGKNTITIHSAELNIFCKENISYQGEVIALIAGPDEDFVQDLVSKTKITITQHNDEKTNSEKETPIVSERTIKTGVFLRGPKSQEKLLAEAKHTISDIWNCDALQNSWFEPGGAFAYIQNKILYVFTPSTQTSHLKKLISSVLNIPETEIVVQKTNSSHGENSLWQNTLLAIKTAVVTHLTQKPCKLMLTNNEHKQFMKKGVRTQIECNSSIKEDGSLLSLQMDITVDIGRANPYSNEIVDRLAIAALSVYTIPNVLVQVKAIRSNKIPTSTAPEEIDFQAFFALENHLTHIAEEAQLLPTEIRQKNIAKNIKTSSMPFLFKTEKILETISNTISISDFERKHASFLLDAKTHLTRENTFFALPIRGIGFACAFDGSGFLNDESFLKQNKVSLTLENEESATIQALKPSLPVKQVWKKIVNTYFGISESNIYIKEEESSKNDEQSFYSNIGITTELLDKCCMDLLKKKPFKKFPITIKKSISPSVKKKWDAQDFKGLPFYSTSFASAAVEVELSLQTYQVSIKGIWVTVDCGKILITKAAENAIRIAIQQELQHLIQGDVLSCKEIHISFIKNNDSPIQIGNLIHSIIPTAFSSALSQSLGIRLHSLPCDTEILYTLGGSNEDTTNP